MLVGIPAVIPNCSELTKAANRRAHEIIELHANWDIQYDKDTRHDATQGAVFP